MCRGFVGPITTRGSDIAHAAEQDADNLLIHNGKLANFGGRKTAENVSLRLNGIKGLRNRFAGDLAQYMICN